MNGQTPTKKTICVKLPIERKTEAANLLLDFFGDRKSREESGIETAHNESVPHYFKMYDDKANKISGFLSVSQTSLKISYHIQSCALEAVKYQAENWEISLDQITYIGIRKKILHFQFWLRFEGMEEKRFPYIVDGCLVLKIPKQKGVNVEQRIMELVNKKYDRIIDQR